MHQEEQHTLQVVDVNHEGGHLKIFFLANRGECAIPFNCTSRLEEQLKKKDFKLAGKTVSVKFTSSGRVNDLVMA